MDSGAKQRDTRGRHYDGLRAEATTRRVGIGVILARDGEVLLGLRGAGTWSFPGGHLDHGESAEACASRELYEEAGLEATNAHVVAETIDDFPEGLRYRTLLVRVDWAGGEPAMREPDACERWEWFPWDALPTPLFLSVANLCATDLRP